MRVGNEGWWKKMTALTHIFIAILFVRFRICLEHAAPVTHIHKLTPPVGTVEKSQENNEIMTSSTNDVNIWRLFFCHIYLRKWSLNGCCRLLLLLLLVFFLLLLLSLCYFVCLVFCSLGFVMFTNRFCMIQICALPSFVVYIFPQVLFDFLFIV